MFKQQTVLDITNVPEEVKGWAYKSYRDTIYGNDSFIRVWPEEVLYHPGFEEGNEENSLPLHEMRIKTLEEFMEEYEDEDQYNFLKWCVEQGQRESFILLYWW